MLRFNQRLKRFQRVLRLLNLLSVPHFVSQLHLCELLSLVNRQLLPHLGNLRWEVFEWNLGILLAQVPLSFLIKVIVVAHTSLRSLQLLRRFFWRLRALFRGFNFTFYIFYICGRFILENNILWFDVLSFDKGLYNLSRAQVPRRKGFGDALFKVFKFMLESVDVRASFSFDSIYLTKKIIDYLIKVVGHALPHELLFQGIFDSVVRVWQNFRWFDSESSSRKLRVYHLIVIVHLDHSCWFFERNRCDLSLSLFFLILTITRGFWCWWVASAFALTLLIFFNLDNLIKFYFDRRLDNWIFGRIVLVLRPKETGMIRGYDFLRLVLVFLR